MYVLSVSKSKIYDTVIIFNNKLSCWILYVYVEKYIYDYTILYIFY